MSKKIIILISMLFVLFSGTCVYAMTESEVDTYNNLYYPQSVYNGGINESPSASEENTYVDPATGNAKVTVTDLTLSGVNGMDLEISRTYNSTNAALFEAYLKETEIPVQKQYFQIVGTKRVYKYYISGSWSSTPTYDVCLSPKFFEYIDTKTDRWMVQNSSQYEYEYDEDNPPVKSKLFSTLAEAEDAIDYLDSVNPEIDATFPYDDIVDWEVNYLDFDIIVVYKTEYVTGYSDGLLADTATERYSKLGPGWEFDFPYIETRYGYEDDYEYLHFGNNGTWLVDFSSDGGANHLEGYSLNDIILTRDTSVTHDGYRSKYKVTEKDGTKYYFGNDGRLLIKEDRFGNQIKFYCDTEDYLNVWGQWKEYPYITRITDTLGRNVVFTFEKTNTSYSIYMTVTEPDNTDNSRVYEYEMHKLTNSNVGILGYDECDDIENDEWVLYGVYDPEGYISRYRYDYLTTKFSFMDRNSTFYYDNYDCRYSNYGNSYIDDDNIEDFYGIHNRYALLKSAKKTGNKEYYFKYSAFVKNCTPSGSMIFYKVYESNEETVYDENDDDVIINHKKYQYDINEVGEYDGYIGYRRDDRISSSYDYEVKVVDESVQTGKTSYDLYKYTYLGNSGEKTILLTRHTDIGTDHKSVTNNTYDNDTKLLTNTNTKNYSVTTPTDYIEYSVSYTYDSDNYGDVITKTPNNISDRATTYTYNSIYHYPVSKTYKKDLNTTIVEEYIPTSDNKSIEYIDVYENNILKSKVHYDHDNYGNITNEKRYTDSDNYIETEYVYQNGAYVISQTTNNVSDNDDVTQNITSSATYDYWGNVTSQTDGNSNTTSYTYDGIDRVLSITNPDNSIKEYQYNSKNTREKDELGKYIRTYYTNSRDVENIYYQSLGVDHNYIYYDAYGNVETEIIYSEETDTNNDQIIKSKTRYTYDTAGRPIQKEVYDVNDTLTYKETYAYEITSDYQKQITSVIGDNNNPTVIKSEYVDNFGNVFKTEIASDYETYEYDYLGNKISVKSANANLNNWTEKQTIQYDYAGNIISQTDELGNTVSNEYDMLGRKIRSYDENEFETDYVYDELGRLIEQRSPFEEAGGTTYYSVKKIWYDNNGNKVKEQSVTNSAGETETYNAVEYTYDNRNNLIMSKAYDGENYNYVQNYYDAKGNLLRVYTGLSSPLEINGLDDVIPGDDEEYAVTKYSYDALGRLLSTADALNRVETNVYDDANGLLIASTDRNGSEFVYEYDALGNLTIRSLSDDTNVETTTYGLTGQVVSRENDNNTISYQYNNKGQLISESDTTSGTTKSYTYDSNGNRISFTVTKNGVTDISQTYTYDKLNRLTSVSENGVVIATYSYDSKGNRTQTVSNGITTTYAYNIANLLTNQSNSKLTESYTYYLNGNQKTKTSNNVTTSYAYDGMNRLVSENDTEYSFDDFGNRIAMANDDIEVTYEYDKNNRLLKSIETSDDSIKTTSYFYDYNGNQINKSIMTNVPYEDVDNADYTLSAETDGNIAIYDYNCYNQLVGVDTDGIKSTYSYSPDGLRLSKTVDGDAITFVYDNSNVVEEISNDGINKYYRGFEIIKNSNDLSYIYDGQGDVVILLDNLGTEVADYAFDAYGNQSEENTVYNPFGYRGEYTDQETGLIYLRARMYDSQTGRFINEDPVKDGLNWYVYCDGNPVNRIDPNGKNWFTNLIKEYFQTQQEIEMARIQANYEAQKNIQREIWRLGAQKYLREQKGYLTSAWMLEHSLQDNPDDIWRGNDSRIAYLINNDNAYLTKLDKAIKSSKSGKISQNLDNIAFKHNDLYYSIHRATIYVDGYKQSNGRWIVHATMKDTYDFTVIQTLMGDDGEFAMQAGLGTVANDAAVVSQSLGAINPYDVTVEFYTTRWENWKEKLLYLLQ